MSPGSDATNSPEFPKGSQGEADNVPIMYLLKVCGCIQGHLFQGQHTCYNRLLNILPPCASTSLIRSRLSETAWQEGEGVQTLECSGLGPPR